MIAAVVPGWLRDLAPDLRFLDPLTRPGPVANTWAIVSLVMMVVAGALVVRGGRWQWRVLLILAAASWPLPDHPAQGPVLLDLSYQHGVHAADLLSVVAVAVAVLPWRRARRRAPDDRRTAPGRTDQGR